MEKNIILYGHGGAYNHGAEAIVKCTIDLVKTEYPQSKIILSTHFKNQDMEFDMPVDEYCERNEKYLDLSKHSNEKGLYDKLIYEQVISKINNGDFCLSIGGDNYCYENWKKWECIHNKAIENNAKSILWSCSIEPSLIDEDMINVLKSHNLITARESITYNELISRGLNNVALCSDVAFLLGAKEVKLPNVIIENNTVAINISPLIVRKELETNIIINNIITLINYIIDYTDMNIALIPHVVMPMDNDYGLLEKIFKQVGNLERVVLISDKLSASEYKYIISKCRFNICARTHSSIASYSSCIPTLVIGYSVKSRGIAKDLDMEEYVVSIDEIDETDKILELFKELLMKENSIKSKLEKIMGKYIENAKVNLNKYL